MPVRILSLPGHGNLRLAFTVQHLPDNLYFLISFFFKFFLTIVFMLHFLCIYNTSGRARF